MINQIQTLNVRQQYFAEYVFSACNALKKSQTTLENIFNDKDIWVMNNITKGVSEKHIEVRFEMATLTCLINSDDVCNGAFLFFDDKIDLSDCIEYCGKIFTYDYQQQHWNIKDGYMFTVMDNDNCGLALSAI